MDNHLGYFVYDDDDDRGVIAIVDGQTREGLIDTFCEEWAHARTVHLEDTEDYGEDTCHHPSFWAEYGRLQKASREVSW